MKYDSPVAQCAVAISLIESGEMLPEYFVINDGWQKFDRVDSAEICRLTLESMTRDGKPLYKFDRTFEARLRIDNDLFDIFRGADMDYWASNDWGYNLGALESLDKERYMHRTRWY